jgi:hypothetical protein
MVVFYFISTNGMLGRTTAAAVPAEGFAIANAPAWCRYKGAAAPIAWFGRGFSWCSSSFAGRFGVSAGFGMTAEKRDY